MYWYWCIDVGDSFRMLVTELRSDAIFIDSKTPLLSIPSDNIWSFLSVFVQLLQKPSFKTSVKKTFMSGSAHLPKILFRKERKLR